MFMFIALMGNRLWYPAMMGSLKVKGSFCRTLREFALKISKGSTFSLALSILPQEIVTDKNLCSTLVLILSQKCAMRGAITQAPESIHVKTTELLD